MLQTEVDLLKNIRTLPKSILKNIGELIVNRIGNDKNAFMITENISGFIDPEKNYKVTLNNLLEKSQQDKKLNYSLSKETNISIPKYAAEFNANWLKEETINKSDANILGGMGELKFELENSEIAVPIVKATAENLFFYNSMLLNTGDTIQFESSDYLPITIVNTGKSYVDKYLMVKGLGDGAYIEYHEQPHFWMPLNSNCSGHILLGRKLNNLYYFTAFTIPFGSAIYSSPYVLHADSFLTGRYLVVYSIAKDYSTVIMKNKFDKLIHLNFLG